MPIATRARAVLSWSLAAVCLAAAFPAFAQAPSVLSHHDRLTYTTAFDALRRGQFEQAREASRRISDRVLLGQLEFERLFHPDYRAEYGELVAWLEAYADLPPAGRVYTLALRRRPADAPPPPLPRSTPALRDWASVQTAGAVLEPPPEPPAPRAAREALNDGDLARAYALAVRAEAWWIAGLAAWRQGDYGHALAAFERVALDPTEDIWVRSGGAVWAARATVAAGRPDRAPEFLRLATRWPATFYGQIAMAQLGQEPVIENLGPQPYLAVVARASAASAPVSDVPVEDLAVFIRDDAQARRAVAFSEIGMWSDARETLRDGIRSASSDEARRLWAGLADSLGPRVSGPADGAIDARNFPMPVLEPDGGFTIERALVYAIARKESGFEARARSSVGAYGIMQVMPTTAAELSGDRGFISNPERLWDPATNLRLGQMYIQRMLAIGPFQGDVMRAVASYNAGPGPMLGALRQLGSDADALLLIESIPVPQARQYVEEVMAAYWIYQRILDRPVRTLEAVASGARLAPLHLDYAPPVQVAATAPEPATP